ncbi:MAG: DNA-binding protein [Pseudomonadota bacterium]
MDKVLTPKDVIAAYPILARSEAVLANWRNQRRGPRFFRVSRKIIYRASDIEAFLFRNPVLTRDSLEECAR